MGALALPAASSIYLDANGFIYSVERVAPYDVLLDGFWRDIRTQGLTVLTSELTLLETLVKPIRSGDRTLEATFRAVLLTTPDIKLAPITRAILDRAAQLRATANLKTADAIHAATALEHGSTLFVTNDAVFSRTPGLSVAILAESLPS